MFQTHIVGAKALIGWAEFLPCSLETPEFMEEHHNAVFGPYGGATHEECVELYNRIGHRQRKNFEEMGFHRRWTFWHLMLKKDLVAIAKGGAEFQRVRPEARKGCLDDLLSKVTDPRWKVRLVVAEDMPLDEARWFMGLENVTCIDDRFVFRRDHWRVISYNTVPRRVQQFKWALEAFVTHAEYREKGDSEQLLRDLIAKVPKG